LGQIGILHTGYPKCIRSRQNYIPGSRIYFFRFCFRISVLARALRRNFHLISPLEVEHSDSGGVVRDYSRVPFVEGVIIQGQRVQMDATDAV
jgi:hypothetical protein